LRGRATPRLRNVVKLARARARERKLSYVGTEHLLLGILEERGNLAVRVIEALEVDPDDLRAEVEAAASATEQPDPKPARTPKLTPLARQAFRLAVQESVRMGHNYIGCEHVLLGLVSEDEGLAGKVLRSMGIELTVTRRATITALSGFLHARQEAEAPAPADAVLQEILERLARLEARLAG
jgi:ATP-dependent Clp protease ATP-binding subunit ClpA